MADRGSENSSTEPWHWSTGVVDPNAEHIELRYGSARDADYERWTPVAMIGPPVHRTFPVRWLIDPANDSAIAADTRRELDFYLVDHPRSSMLTQDPWEYAVYHCGTTANVYSSVHWSYFSRSRTMTPPSTVTTALSSEWRRPAENWVDIVERYITYVQVPAWRVNAFTRNGAETRPCIPAAEAAQLRAQMLRAVEGIARRQSTIAALCPASEQDLAALLDFAGRHVPKADRCSKEIRDRLQRAFLLNASGYTCVYCGRTAWGVYDETTGAEPPRTLRFEIDHRTPRRKVAGVDHSNNLVVACRSCNTIKGEMTEERFLAELRSLAAAVARKP